MAESGNSYQKIYEIVKQIPGAAILILAATGIFAYAVAAKAWNELFD